MMFTHIAVQHGESTNRESAYSRLEALDPAPGVPTRPRGAGDLWGLLCFTGVNSIADTTNS